MSTSAIGLFSSVESILSSALQKVGLAPNATGSSLNGIGGPTSAQQPDNSQLSPLGQVLSTLQELQQSNPTEYKQVTQQIATNLTSAAQTAQSDGNTNAANQLTQLASDFTNASTSGQLPNIQDLAQALGGGGHHHHHHSDAGSSSSDSTGASGSSSQTQNNTLSPLSIITNTLSSAGVTSSNS
ncbi:MAG: hypothetical protein ABSG41_29265 [Bryobacteraceae bacterium]